MEPAKIFEYLDENYEIPNFRLPILNSAEEYENFSSMANWLLNNTSSTQFMNYYTNIRSENMLKTLKNISNQITCVSVFRGGSKSHFIKK